MNDPYYYVHLCVRYNIFLLHASFFVICFTAFRSFQLIVCLKPSTISDFSLFFFRLSTAKRYTA